MQYEVVLQKEAQKFLLSLPEIDRAKAVKILEYLAISGVNLASPYVKNITGKLWELRAGQVRLFYFIHQGQFIVVSGFIKKSRKTPKQEINKALNEIEIYPERSKSEDERRDSPARFY